MSYPRRLLRQLILGSPIEGFARSVQARVFGNRGHRYDLQTIEIIRKSVGPYDNCVDVGCHRGSILQEMICAAPHGSHYAFEPIPELYTQLVSRFPMVSVQCLAIADFTGSSTFSHVVSNPGLSGLRQRQLDCAERVEELTVATDSLDNLIGSRSKIALIKVDVEGGEFAVLNGARQLIQTSRPVIVFEHGLGAADFYGVHPEKMFELCRELGLRVWLLDAYLSNGPDLTKAQFEEEFWSRRNYYFVARA